MVKYYYKMYSIYEKWTTRLSGQLACKIRYLYYASTIKPNSFTLRLFLNIGRRARTAYRARAG